MSTYEAGGHVHLAGSVHVPAFCVYILPTQHRNMALATQRFFEAILLGSIPVVQDVKHTGRSAAERGLGYKFYMQGDAPPLVYRADWAEQNLAVFMRHQTLMWEQAEATSNVPTSRNATGNGTMESLRSTASTRSSTAAAKKRTSSSTARK